MNQRQSIEIRTTVTVVGAIVGVAAIALVATLIQTVANTTIPFDNDEANHAIDGWEVYHALAKRSLQDLFLAVRNQGFYPPVHSFFIAAAYVVDGPSVASSRMPTVINFVLMLLGLAWLIFRTARGETGDSAKPDAWIPAAGAVFAVALGITSHILVVNAVLCMLEMTGAMLAIFLMLLADRVDRLPPERTQWLGTGAAALLVMLIFLSKYSFGLFYAPSLMAALVTTTWPWRSNRRAWLQAGVVAGVYVIAIASWILITHRQTMWMFFTDHRHYVPLLSAENLRYLPKLWLHGYSSNAMIGIAAIPLASIGAVRQWKRLSVRVAVWSIFAGMITLTISTTNEPRHILAVVPAIWMLTGLGLVNLLRWLQNLPGGGSKVVTLLALLMALVIIGAIRPASRLRADLVNEFEGTPVLAEMQDFALEHIDLDQPVLFMGNLSDQNGLLAIRWRAAVLMDRSLWRLDIDYFPFENREHSIQRTHRKPQIASSIPSFPRKPLSAVLDRAYYAHLVAVRRLDQTSDFSPPDSSSPLHKHFTTYRLFPPWVVVIYDLTTL
jgi:4-amino-4-deoxy-L-arabinose transferase-like glycosyltransferase